MQEGIVLRPYQDECVRKILAQFELSQSTLAVLATGLGKTVIGWSAVESWLAKHPGRALWLAHREELISQAFRAASGLTSLHLEIEQADLHATGNLIFDGNSAVVGSMQSLVSGRRCRACAERVESDYYAWQLANPGMPEEEWPGAELGCEECDGGRIRRMARFNPDDFSIVVIDECFPAGTLIDGRPIESIRPGDRVRSVNHATGEIEMRRVVRVMKSRPRMTCTVRFASGRELFCTTGHPFWVAGVGYVPAICLERFDSVCIDRRFSAGPKEGRVFGVDWVDSVEVHEPGSRRESEGLRGGSYVYNLEVEGNHNYFANGVLVHNCHHAVSKEYRRIVRHFSQNPKCKILGVTATPDRSDEIGLNEVFGSVAYRYEILEGIRDGYLVPIKQASVCVEELDLSEFRQKKTGDFKDADLKKAFDRIREEAALHKIAVPIIEQAGDRQTIVFVPDVATAEELADILNRYKPGKAEFICGDRKITPKQHRKQILDAYARGELQYVVNCQVLCLDAETEILTSDGWVGIDDMTMQHKVANWNFDGTVFFEEPKLIVRRDRMPGERMVVLETPRRSIRVTEHHRMLYRKRSGADYRIVHAANLVGVPGQIPICGIAEPFDDAPEQPVVRSGRKLQAAIRANSYNLRKAGMPPDVAREEAIRRISRRDSLRYKSPCELSTEECFLIGFWVGDGSKNALKSGGVEYTLCQSSVYPAIIDRVEAALGAIGIDYIRREKVGDSGNPYVVWSIPRGTGYGPQERSGIFHLEPYLDKDGSRFLWGMSREQFICFIHGLWAADGNHGNSAEPPKSFSIGGTNYRLFSTLQAIAVCRGMSASITLGANRKKNPRYAQDYVLTIHRRQCHTMSHGNTMAIEEGWKPERVWCVTSTTGNIITRRRGTVTVTGNTEGFDAPVTSCIAMARPTGSRALMAQCIGRGTRVLPGVIDGIDTAEGRRAAIAASPKPDLLVLDFWGNSGKHKLVGVADVLGGREAPEIVDLARRRVREQSPGKPVDMEEELELARQQVQEIKERERKRAADLTVRAKYKVKYVDPFDIFATGRVPSTFDDWERRKKATPRQREALRKLGLPDEVVRKMTIEEAAERLDVLCERINMGLSSYKQCMLLKRYGVDGTDLTFHQAQKVIDAIAARRWRVPRGYVHSVVQRVKRDMRAPLARN